MADQKLEKKRKRTRKARTEVSSSSSSSTSGEDSDSPPPTQRDNKNTGSNDNGDDERSTDQRRTVEDANEIAATHVSHSAQPKDPEQAFEDFYLRQATREFSSDLDKLRTAPDFRDSSVPILIQALRQGAACFTPDERKKVGNASLDARSQG